MQNALSLIMPALCWLASLCSLAAPLNAAAWQLDNASSQLTFITTKAIHVSEQHRFEKLDGAVADDGSVSLSIDLASVETLIPIRNERMREMLFRVADYPSASLTTAVDIESLADMAPGQSQDLDLSGQIAISGGSTSVDLFVTVMKLADGSVQVTSRQPVLVTAASVDLVAGVEMLREVAGLPSISHTVPVSFTLNFKS